MLEYPYMQVPAADGTDTIFRPIIPLIMEGPAGRCILDVLVDTGADAVLIPTGLAARIGIELSDAPSGYTKGISGDPIPYFEEPSTLELRRNSSILRWTTRICFAENPARNLFGHRGGLEYFHTHFLGPERLLRLRPQANLPN